MEGKILGIYCYKSEFEKSIKNGYYFLFLGDTNNLLDTDTIMNIFSKLKEKKLAPDFKEVGPFTDLDELSQFAFKACEETNLEGVYLLSNDDYNSVVRDSSTLSEAREKIVRSANIVENVEIKRNLWDKLIK